ncbi:MAG: hypothetical protein DYH15_12415 [Nitrosomonas sp. PRO4]|nr:hypothetical protein [Nitrosomonas sp. PRO4]
MIHNFKVITAAHLNLTKRQALHIVHLEKEVYFHHAAFKNQNSLKIKQSIDYNGAGAILL